MNVDLEPVVRDVSFKTRTHQKPVTSGFHLSHAGRKVQSLLKSAGIEINGTRSFDILVHDQRFYRRILSGGSLALGETYVEGWWDCARLDIFFTRMLHFGLADYVPDHFHQWLLNLQTRLGNHQSASESLRNVDFHYNIGNDLFEIMLDKRMTYSCGYWHDAFTLDEAQEAKLDLVCRKLYLQPGMRLLDIGCGWGSFAKYAAEKYRVQVTGITLSKQQHQWAESVSKDLPVRYELKDYRDLHGKYDRIVSIGMFEHVGPRNYESYFEKANECLATDGIFLLHTIGSRESSFHSDPWLTHYIFPNSFIPGMTQVSKAFENHFVLEDVHNFGPDYDHTLMAWHSNIVNQWQALSRNYSGMFLRMWEYYLLSCAATFRARKNQLWQIVLTKGLPGGYRSVR